MRLLGLTNFYPPLGYGYGAICGDVMEEMAARGHDVTVLCAEGGQGSGNVLVRQGLGHVPGAWRRPRAGLRAEAASQRLVRDALAEGIDAAIVWHMRGIGKGSLTLLHQAEIPVLYALGDLWVVYERPGPPAAWPRWSRLDASRAYRALRTGSGAAVGRAIGAELRPPPIAEKGICAFVSDWLRLRYAEAGFVPVDGRVIPNGIDLTRFPGHRGPSLVLSRALFVGRLDASKGVDLAIEAVARVPGTTLTIMGGGSPTDVGAVEQRIARLGAEDRVKLLGPRPRQEVVSALLEHDVLLMPGRIDEAFGLVYLEAMANGVPVIGTATGGAAEICVNEVNALITEPSTAEVADALVRLRDDPQFAARLAAEGRQTAERFSLAVMVNRYEGLLRAAVTGA